MLLSADRQQSSSRVRPTTRTRTTVGPKTFIDKVAIKTGEKQRIYESDNNGVFERVSIVLDVDAGRFIVSRESPTDAAAAVSRRQGARTQLTHNQD